VRSVLSGAEGSNHWNDWNGPVPVMNGAQRLNDLNGVHRCEFPRSHFADACFSRIRSYASLLAASRRDRAAAPPLRSAAHSWNGYIVFVPDRNHIGSPTQCGSTRFTCRYLGSGCTECLGFPESRQRDLLLTVFSTCPTTQPPLPFKV
jgi:hypothetical protein